MRCPFTTVRSTLRRFRLRKRFSNTTASRHISRPDAGVAYSDCSLLSHSTEDIPEESYAEQLAQRGGKPVTTYVPFRNGLFLSAAASVALSKNCSVIYYGAHHDDAAGNAYPDCSEEFVNAMNHSIVLGSGGDVRIELRSCVGTRRRSLPKVCGCRFLSADVELLRGRRQAVRQVRHLSGPHPRV